MSFVSLTGCVASGSAVVASDCGDQNLLLLLFLEGKVDATNIRRFAVLVGFDDSELIIYFSRLFVRGTGQGHQCTLRLSEQPRPAHVNEIWLEQKMAAAKSFVTANGEQLTPNCLHKRLAERDRSCSVTSLNVLVPKPPSGAALPPLLINLEEPKSYGLRPPGGRGVTNSGSSIVSSLSSMSQRGGRGNGRGRLTGQDAPALKALPDLSKNFELDNVGPATLSRFDVAALQAMCAARGLTPAKTTEELVQVLLGWKCKRKVSASAEGAGEESASESGCDSDAVSHSTPVQQRNSAAKAKRRRKAELQAALRLQGEETEELRLLEQHNDALRGIAEARSATRDKILLLRQETLQQEQPQLQLQSPAQSLQHQHQQQSQLSTAQHSSADTATLQQNSTLGQMRTSQRTPRTPEEVRDLRRNVIAMRGAQALEPTPGRAHQLALFSAQLSDLQKDYMLS